MSLSNNAARFSRWSVYVEVKGKRLRKKFADDISGALRFYVTCKAKGLNATLHSDNVGFLPPKKLTHHEKVKYKIVKRRGKKYKQKVVTITNLMEGYNDKGIWWCPYCLKLRHFEERTEGRRKKMLCPTCGVSNYDFNVRRSNPKALIIEMYGRRTRGSSRKRRRTR